MKRTALQEAIDNIPEPYEYDDIRDYHTAVIESVSSLLPLEREQIEEAYDTGISDGQMIEYGTGERNDKYYNQTFESDESKSEKNL
jgi:hypothetical protein